MGYILPITDHQSQQYVKRDTKIKGKPFFVNRSAAVSSATEAEVFNHHVRSQFSGNAAVFPEELEEKIHLQEQRLEEVISEITGLGRHFNKTI